MKHKKYKYCALLVLGLGISGLQAQESINSAGGEASGEGGSATFSVGQVVYMMQTGTNGSAAEGVQQPWEISVATGIDDNNWVSLSISAFPNPTTDHLLLQVEDEPLDELSYQLYDMNGKLLGSSRITDTQTTIDVMNLEPSSYILTVARANREIKTFIIIKN